MLTACDIHAMAAACGIPHVDVLSYGVLATPHAAGTVGMVEVYAPRPRSVPVGHHLAWCARLAEWIGDYLPLYAECNVIADDFGGASFVRADWSATSPLNGIYA